MAENGLLISQLPAASSAAETDLIEIERGGRSYKITLAEIGTALGLDDFVEQILDVLG
jgi:hypothetical protein